jgi:hypothetical protein
MAVRIALLCVGVHIDGRFCLERVGQHSSRTVSDESFQYRRVVKRVTATHLDDGARHVDLIAGARTKFERCRPRYRAWLAVPTCLSVE